MARAEGLSTRDGTSRALRVAGIDVGSNGIRLIVADATGPGSFTVVHRDRAAVRLGHQAFTKGHLDVAVVRQAVEALAAFRRKTVDLGVHRVRAVATSAVRDAEDGKDFTKAVRKKTGLRVEIIDGREEARILHRAVRTRIPWNGKPWLLMDLGGGSLEIALVDHATIHWSESRRVGTVRLLEKHASEAEGPMLAERIHAEVDAFQLLHSPAGLDIGGLAATGGNINDAARLVGHSESDEPVALALDALIHFREDLEGLDLAQRMAVHGLRPDRADVVVPAAMVYERIAYLAGQDTILVPGWGLREGLVLGLIDDHFVPREQQAPLDRNVEEGAIQLGRTFGFDEDHAQHTARLSLQMFDALHDLHRLQDAERRVLHAAAILHDIGQSIADQGHHKHSQYLIEHAELPGLSHEEVQMAATVARYHRKALPQEHHHLYRLFSTGVRRKVDHLSAMLRLADGLDREHVQRVDVLSVRATPGYLKITIAGRGPLDVAKWAGQQKADLLERAFSRPVEIQEEA